MQSRNIVKGDIAELEMLYGYGKAHCEVMPLEFSAKSKGDKSENATGALLEFNYVHNRNLSLSLARSLNINNGCVLRWSLQDKGRQIFERTANYTHLP